MNTVLDDNKMLCLANSERIKLTPSMHMVFEVQVRIRMASTTHNADNCEHTDNHIYGSDHIDQSQ